MPQVPSTRGQGQQSTDGKPEGDRRWLQKTGQDREEPSKASRGQRQLRSAHALQGPGGQLAPCREEAAS